MTVRIRYLSALYDDFLPAPMLRLRIKLRLDLTIRLSPCEGCEGFDICLGHRHPNEYSSKKVAYILPKGHKKDKSNMIVEKGLLGRVSKMN